MLFKEQKEQERHNLSKKASGKDKVPEELFQNSAVNGKDHANSVLKDSEPDASCNNESINGCDVISKTSKGDNATPKIDIETGFSADGTDLIKKKPAYKHGVFDIVVGKKEIPINFNWYRKFSWFH